MADKSATPKTEKKLVAYAAFDFRRWYEPVAKHYNEGDEFIPGEGLTRDPGFDEFRTTGKDKKVNGITFTEIGDVISADPKKRSDPAAERYVYRHTLPLKEA